MASKNSLPKKITGPFFISLKFLIHLTLLFLILFFCIFDNSLLFSYKNIFNELLNSGKCLKIFTKTLRLPSPGPSSTKLNFSGLPNFSQVDTTHMAIISENKFEIVGAVTKSPFLPKGIFFE